MTNERETVVGLLAYQDCGHAKCAGEPVPNLAGNPTPTLTCHRCRIRGLEAELAKAKVEELWALIGKLSCSREPLTNVEMRLYKSCQQEFSGPGEQAMKGDGA